MPVKQLSPLQNLKKKLKNKFLLLTGSTATGCSAKLKDKPEDKFDVTRFVKPYGKLNNLVESIAPLPKNFNKDDCVIILGGTNDVEINENYDLKL